MHQSSKPKFCIFWTIVLIIFCPSSALHAGSSPNRDRQNRLNLRGPIEQANAFEAWLSSHESTWTLCRPKLKGDTIELCDSTLLEAKEIKWLYSLNPKDLVSFIKNKKIGIEVYCKKSGRQTFESFCIPNLKRNQLKQLSDIHGQYLPTENTIVIQSDAYPGSLVHEYMHYLQYQNNRKTNGKIYKRSRMEIEEKLISALDQLILEVKSLEAEGRKKEAIELLKPGVALGSTLAAFGKWQKLIDERNLFLVSTLFVEELGVPEIDRQLAKKNLGFLCNDPQLKDLLKGNPECAESN